MELRNDRLIARVEARARRNEWAYRRSAAPREGNRQSLLSRQIDQSCRLALDDPTAIGRLVSIRKARGEYAGRNLLHVGQEIRGNLPTGRLRLTGARKLLPAPTVSSSPRETLSDRIRRYSGESPLAAKSAISRSRSAMLLKRNKYVNSVHRPISTRKGPAGWKPRFLSNASPAALHRISIIVRFR